MSAPTPGRPRFVAFPRDASDYTVGFYAALGALGVDVDEGIFAARWIHANVHRGDVAHFHWPSFDYRRAGRFALVVGFLRWMFVMALIRVKGARIVWSGHNVLPHDRAVLPWIDVLGRHLTIFASDFVFLHGTNAACKMIERFPAVARKARLLPHGNWIGYHPHGPSRDAMRARLGIASSTFVYLLIGACKPYKNLESLIGQFFQVRGDVRLLIVGGFPDARYEHTILDLATGDARISVHRGYVPHEEMHGWLVASDAIVAPYRESLTSGTAVLAMSVGRPVVSLATGHLLDVVTPETGVLYDAANPDGLRTALEAARSVPFDEAKILAHARRFTFADAAALTLAALTEDPVPTAGSVAAAGDARAARTRSSADVRDERDGRDEHNVGMNAVGDRYA